MAGVACVFVLAMVASADAITFKQENFALLGSGSLMDSPVQFNGDIIQGTLAPGTFWIRLDDTSWPSDNPGTPENERLDYVLSHYFTYDATPGNEGWDGYFPPAGSGEPMPKWRFYTVAGDTLGGDCNSFVLTIRDVDADGIVDEGEYARKVFSANFIAYISYSGGCYNFFCGVGNCSGALDVTDQESLEEELYVPSATSASGNMILRDDNCHTATEASSWGGIKSIYRD